LWDPNHAAFDGVAKFPHIARPVVGKKQVRREVAQTFDITLEFAIVMLDEESRQGPDVIGPLAEGRNRDLDDVEPEIEILAERSFFHGLPQIFVCRGHHAKVELDVNQTAQAAEALFLQDP